MCGIAGIYTPAGQASGSLAEEMNRILFHRGPDDGDVWVQGEIALVHRRLSILDLSQAGHQPMAFSERGLWISYNGEVYNFLDLRKELETLGYTFFSNCDTEVILKGYDAWGEDVFNRLRGMFALAIWDEQKHELILARDPFGIKPLYYTDCGDDFIFGSELKALRLHPQFNTEVDVNSLAYYVSHLYIPEPNSIFRNVSRLPAGHMMRITEDDRKIIQYYRPEQEINTKRSYQDTLHELVEVLRESVRSHLIADVPLGVFLSGGIDSNILVALMRQVDQDVIKSFTIGFDGDFKSFDERSYAQITADHFGTEHHEIVVQPDIAEYVENKLFRTFDEPFGNPSALISDVLAEFTRSEVTVALNGVGGDEFFFGYPRYLGMVWSDRYAKVPRILRQAVELTLDKTPRNKSRYSFFEKARRLVNMVDAPSEMRYERFTSFVPDGTAASLLAPEFVSQLNDSAYIVENNVHDTHVVNRLMELDLSNYLPGDLLTYTDRTSMQYALEVRVPFCDIEVAKFSRSVPPQYKLSGNTLKHMLKDAFKDVLPEKILTGKKKGFSVPLGHWLSGPLRPMVKDLLSKENLSQQPFFDSKAVTKALTEFEQGQYQYSYMLWTILVFNLWHSKLEVAYG